MCLSLVAYPMGRFMAWTLPLADVDVPTWVPLIGGSSYSLNPGPFGIKEHALIAIMASVSNVQAYGLQASVASQIYYKIEFPVGSVPPSSFILQVCAEHQDATVSSSCWSSRRSSPASPTPVSHAVSSSVQRSCVSLSLC